MSAERWFYRTEAEWDALAQRLKLTPCPRCHVVGALNRHGSLYGFDEEHPRRKTLRARRVLCSNRQARPGCGHTTSVWRADQIRRCGLTTSGLGRFLHGTVADGVAAAIRGFGCYLTPRTLYRLWKRFRLAQSILRTALCGRCPPPVLPAEHRIEAHVLAHLQAAFPGASCPLAAFQHARRTFVI